ncbi:MAG: hypothetical protein HY257_11665, partial [Chloroflexi bacterium]|nr:hypothetical protein [Chloroflexota bacterium]
TFPRRRGIIGPLILITIGVLLLLANLGYLPFSFWEIAARFWPLVLILIGLDIIFGRQSMLASLALIALWILLLAGIFWYALSQNVAAPTSAPATGDAINEPLGALKSATINLNLGISPVTINALSNDSNDLVNGTFSHSPGLQITKTFTASDSEGKFILKEEGNVLAGNVQSKLDLSLTQKIPLQIKVNGGVGRATLDLANVNAPTVNYDAGVGALQITAPKNGVTTMKVNGGVGAISITIPPGVAARIRVNIGVGGVNVDTARFSKAGEYYQSADFASAQNRLDLDASGGVGAITIR